MASLTGNLVAETYKALLKTIDNDILTASEKQITDGLGGGSNVFIDSNGFLRANKYKVTNGLATQFLKADGSLDANTYLTSITGAQVITALGFTPVTDQRTLTINGVTYNLTANRSWTVAGTAAIWGNITGTLSNQTDLQAALNAKFNVPAGTISQYIRGDGSLATFPTLPGGLPTGGTAGQILAKINSTDYNTEWIDNFATQTKNEVKLGQTLAKGAAVYVSSADGTNIVVSAASNTSEALSSKTFGLLETGGSTNAFVKCVTFGLLAGLNTTGATAGDPVWLGVNGALIYGLANKPYAPKHLVYIGVVTRVNANNGEIFVNVQNGFELKEIHDVYIVDPANNHGLFYDIVDGLWKNKSIAGALGYTPQAQLSGTGFVKSSGTTISYDNSTYLTTADAASTYQLLTNLSTDLTASATKYPSVNAVIAGLATKLNLTGGTLTGSITATSFIKTGGTAFQYLKADGSVAEITGDIISGAGSAGYVPKWTSAIVLGSSLLYDNGTSMSIGTITLNYGGYGRTLTGSGFAATSFGFEAVTGSTTNGGLIGGLSLVIANNDASRRIGSQIQSYISGATATNQGADLRFYVKPDAGVLLEIVRMTSAGITFNKDLTATNITATAFIKSGGTSSQFLMADGSVSTLSSPVTGSGSAGYIPKWTSAANIGSSIIYEDTSIGIAYTTPNRGGYGRTLSGAAFGSASFGFEAVSNTTTNGGLIGGLSFIVNQNDSSRIVGSAIQSNLIGTTATNYGADLRFFAKADAVFTIAEVARMTSAGLRVYGTIVKDGGTSSQYLMADGSVSTGLANAISGSLTSGYIPRATGANTLGNSLLQSATSRVFIFQEDSYFGIDAQDSTRIGFTKKAGAQPFVSYAADPFTIRSTTGSDIGATNIFVTKFSMAINGDATFSNDLTITGTTKALSVLKMSGSVDPNATDAAYFWNATGVGPTLSGLKFQVRVGATQATKLFVTDLGYLGVNTVTPQSNLVVSNDLGTQSIELNQLTGVSRIFAINRSAGTAIPLAINDPGGNVLIGTTTDSGFRFDVSGTGRFSGQLSLSTLVTSGSATFGSDVFTYNNGGIFFSGGGSYASGIFQNTNGLNLQVSGSPVLRLAYTTGNAIFSGNVTASGTKSQFIADGGTVAGAEILLKNNLSTSAANRRNWSIATEDQIEGDFAIKSSNVAGGATITTRLAILSNGYVGINMTSPIYQLDVTTANYKSFRIRSSDDALITIGSTIASSQFYSIGASSNVSGQGANLFWIGRSTDNPSGSLTKDFIISSSGNIGIRTTPARALDVNGQIGLNNDLVSTKGGTTFRIGYDAYVGNSAVNLFTESAVALALGTSASESMRISPNGNILIGSTIDNSHKLRIVGNTYTSGYIYTASEGTGIVVDGETSASLGRVGLMKYGGFEGMLISGRDTVIRLAHRTDNPYVLGGSPTIRVDLLIATNGAATFSSSVTATSFFESSDFRLKTLIEHNPIIAGIENLEAKLYEKNGKIEIGYFAQDAELIMPYAVTKNDDGFLNLSYREVHTAKIARLEKEVAELKEKLNLN